LKNDPLALKIQFEDLKCNLETEGMAELNKFLISEKHDEPKIEIRKIFTIQFLLISVIYVRYFAHATTLLGGCRLNFALSFLHA